MATISVGSFVPIPGQTVYVTDRHRRGSPGGHSDS